MFKKSKMKIYLQTTVVLAAILLLIGCAAKKPFWGDPKSGIILRYQIPKDQPVQYQNSMNMVQSMDMMGQEMKSTSKMGMKFTAKSKGMQKDIQNLDILIDDLAIKVESPQGNINPDLSSVIGKNFNMDLSVLGKELNFDGAKKLSYTMGPQGERDIHSYFQTIFPDLAGKPLKVGDTWTTYDTVDVDEGGVKLQMLFKNSNTLTGFETVEGKECAKVTAKVKGTMSGSGVQNGADLEFEGDIEADDMWYFAYKRGLVVKQNTDSFVEGTIIVSGPADMSIPMTMEMTFETKLVK